MTDRPYTVAELAARWGVSPTFVYGLLNSGALSGIKLGRKLWRVKPDEVERYENSTLDIPLDATPPQPVAAMPKNERDAAARLLRFHRWPI